MFSFITFCFNPYRQPPGYGVVRICFHFTLKSIYSERMNGIECRPRLPRDSVNKTASFRDSSIHRSSCALALVNSRLFFYPDSILYSATPGGTQEKVFVTEKAGLVMPAGVTFFGDQFSLFFCDVKISASKPYLYMLVVNVRTRI